MITIQNKQIYAEGEIWLLECDSEDWQKAWMLLPYFVQQDLELKPGKNLQKHSDLDIYTLPIYACKIPSVIFFPYLTCFTGTRFNNLPSFIIPNKPLNRLEGKNWLDNLALSPFNSIEPQFPNVKLGWIEANGKIKPENTIDHTEFSRLALAAQIYTLDEIRYVYDSDKSILDARKNNKPTRYQFNEKLAKVEITKEYLEWYISTFNDFFPKLLEIGEQDDKTKRAQFLVAGWTINRLAIDVLTISITNAPYVRKWQFFGFLDALANLINQFTEQKTNSQNDAKTFCTLLTREYYTNFVKPKLESIPIPVVRDEVLSSAERIYEAIEKMKIGDEILNRDNKRMKPQELLRLYRNSRHGYALGNEVERKALVLHGGDIPNDLPDLSIALWHYVLLSFPFDQEKVLSSAGK